MKGPHLASNLGWEPQPSRAKATVCPTPAKTAYLDRDDAEAAALLQGVAQYAYRCPSEAHWHLTSKRVSGQAARRRDPIAEGSLPTSPEGRG